MQFTPDAVSAAKEPAKGPKQRGTSAARPVHPSILISSYISHRKVKEQRQMPKFNPFDFLPLFIIYPEEVVLESRAVGDKGRVMRTQYAWVKKPNLRHPERFKFSISDDQQFAYSEGQYVLDPSSYKVGDFDALELNRFGIKLVPVPPEFLALAKS